MYVQDKRDKGTASLMKQTNISMCPGLAKGITRHLFFSFLFLPSPGTDSSGSHGVMNQSVLTYAANRTCISFKIRSSVLNAHDFILYSKNISLS